MFDGQYIFSKDAAGFSVWGPWGSKGGDRVRFVLDLIDC